MDIELIRDYIANFQTREFKGIVERDLKVKPIKDKAISIIGPRRAGKTYYFFNIISKLNRREVLYLDFEEAFLEGVKATDVLKIVLKIFPSITRNLPKFVFLDEIQNLENWERLVRSLLNYGFNVFITGSSSKLLSKEIATQLRGRTLTYELFPFSFKEILRLEKIEISKFLTEREISKIKKILQEYLFFGGFPEIWIRKDFREEILKEYMEIMIYRDLIERWEIRNYKAIKLFLKLAINNFSSKVSINSFEKYIKNLGIRVSRNSLYNYLEYSNDAYILFPLRRFSYSLKELEQTKPKIYVIDNGLIRIFSHRISENIGRLMENLVFLHLRRRYKENESLFYYETKNRKEIDFLVKENGIKLFEVSYYLDESHVKKVLDAMEELKLKEATIITWDEEDLIETNGKRIRAIPLWKWLIYGTKNS